MKHSKYYYEYTRNMDIKHASAEELKKINDRIFNANWRIKLSGTKSWEVCRESIFIFWLYP